MKFSGESLVGFRPPRIAMTFVLIAAAVQLFAPLRLHPALPVAATVTGVVGCAIMLRGWWLFRLAGTAICPTKESTSLLTHDIFSLSRNPMYLGIILMLAALAMATGSAPFYMAVLGYGTVMDRVFCPFEERKSLSEFGEAYTKYAHRVPRWL